LVGETSASIRAREAEAESLTPEKIVQRILEKIEVP